MSGDRYPSPIVSFPWYEEGDYPQFQSPKPTQGDAISYECWQRAASSEVFRQLASGRAVEIVSIRPDRYRAWIAQRGLPDSCDARRRYAAILSSGC